jgi:hypothetical protein
MKTAKCIPGTKKMFSELWESANKIISGTTTAYIASKCILQEE